ncbi:MAG: hypothetical protein H6836_02205 [Planctomycetes bacterium]|nr:hypothetical protein [Planctomycetota bacterium]MCB9888361.1 hypothetical protein [Planctomycetota bacterium]
MKISSVLLSIATLTSAAFAQNIVVPSQFDTVEGTYYHSRFGVFADMRLQWCDGELPAGAHAIKGFGLREDVDIGPWTQYGRKHDLTVYASDGDNTTMTSTFSANILSTPTMVFSGSIALPQASSPTTGPAPWAAAYNFAFSTTYVHTGAKDLLLDMTFTNGTLDNNVAWTSASYRGYFLDSYTGGNTSSSSIGARIYYPGGTTSIPTTGGCADSNSTVTSTSYNYTYLLAYGPNYSTTSLRNMMRGYVYGYYVPPSTNIASVIGFGTNVAGSSFPGVSCQKVFVDLNLPYLVLFATSATSTLSYTNFYNYFLGGSSVYIPYNPAYVGLKVTTQSAWTDTGNSSLKITSASVTSYPEFVPDLKRKSVYSTTAAAATGTLSTSTYYDTVRQYVK